MKDLLSIRKMNGLTMVPCDRGTHKVRFSKVYAPMAVIENLRRVFQIEGVFFRIDAITQDEYDFYFHYEIL